MSIFDEVKQRVSMQDAVNYLQLGRPAHIEQGGTQWRWKCPRCKSNDDRSLCVNQAKGFGCWVGARGNTPRVKGNDPISLVAYIKEVRQRDAAQMLFDHFCSASRPVPRNSPKPPAEKESGPLAPLDYLDAEHEIGELIGVSPAAAHALGAGYAPRGTMAGRFLIPLRMEDGRLVGYMGIATKEDMAPLLLFPKNLEQKCLEASHAEPERPSDRPAPDELRKLLRVV